MCVTPGRFKLRSAECLSDSWLQGTCTLPERPCLQLQHCVIQSNARFNAMCKQTNEHTDWKRLNILRTIIVHFTKILIISQYFRKTASGKQEAMLCAYYCIRNQTVLGLGRLMIYCSNHLLCMKTVHTMTSNRYTLLLQWDPYGNTGNSVTSVDLCSKYCLYYRLMWLLNNTVFFVFCLLQLWS